MATPGLTFSTTREILFKAPGLVSDTPPKAWDQQTILLPSFGLKGVSVLYGERTTRPFVVPMVLWGGVGFQWNNTTQREAAINAIIAKQGKVAWVTLANYAGTVTSQYANCFFDRIEIGLKRNGSTHGYWAKANLFFLEIASTAVGGGGQVLVQ